MKAVIVMYDSLNKNFLKPYGCSFIKTPNFNRLSGKAIKFDNFYVGSMPCMPARREIHTGRYGFLHRGWGPLEPFDDSMPEILKNSGVYTHLTTDHYHYLEDGGATYHNRYSSWELFRGQEGDFWKGELTEPDYPECDDSYEFKKKFTGRKLRQDFINRKYMKSDKDMPQSKSFRAGLDFIDRNHSEDNWFLHIETFDPHEPFFTQKEYKDLYPHEYNGKHFDWPNYSMVVESDEVVLHARMEYAALVSMCDAKLGLVLDAFDKYNLWEDTMLIVNTDHGFLLGEHSWWGKTVAPLYNEIANIPFFIYDPRFKQSGTCKELCQTIDIAPTLMDYFDKEIPKDMQGKPLKTAYRENKKIRDTAIYGYFGSTLNITDGRYTYMRAPVHNYRETEYTLMPTDMTSMFKPEEFTSMELHKGFSFTKNAKVMKIPREGKRKLPQSPHDLLFDLKNDPKQKNNINDEKVKAMLCNKMIDHMKKNEAPLEQFKRMGLPTKDEMTVEMLNKQEKDRNKVFGETLYTKYSWDKNGREYFNAILGIMPKKVKDMLITALEEHVEKASIHKLTISAVDDFFEIIIQKNPQMREMKFLIDMYRGYFTER